MVNKISLCVFSKDRPAQLRLLLESLQANAKDLFDINVIYRASSPEYELGYTQLFQERTSELPIVHFIDENVSDNFKQLVLDVIDNGDFNLFAFATDDTIFYRDINSYVEDPYVEIEHALNHEDCICYSLRLGVNIHYENYYTNQSIVIPNTQLLTPRTLAWEWKKCQPSVTGYPLSVDMHIFKRKVIKSLVDRAVFDSPNSLEGNMSSWAHTIKQDYITSPLISMAFCNSINRTQDIWQNYAGGKYPMTIKELNDKYLSGEVIDFKKLEFGNIKSTHDEIQLVWRTLR